MAVSRQSLYSKGINCKEVMVMDVIEVERVRMSDIFIKMTGSELR